VVVLVVDQLDVGLADSERNPPVAVDEGTAEVKRPKSAEPTA
jgi:hypothetical protein